VLSFFGFQILGIMLSDLNMLRVSSQSPAELPHVVVIHGHRGHLRAKFHNLYIHLVGLLHGNSDL